MKVGLQREGEGVWGESDSDGGPGRTVEEQSANR